MIDAHHDQTAQPQTDPRLACPQFQPVSPVWAYPVNGYCVRADPPGRLMIPSLEETRTFCAVGRAARCPWRQAPPPRG